MIDKEQHDLARALKRTMEELVAANEEEEADDEESATDVRPPQQQHPRRAEWRPNTSRSTLQTAVPSIEGGAARNGRLLSGESETPTLCVMAAGATEDNRTKTESPADEK